MHFNRPLILLALAMAAVATAAAAAAAPTTPAVPSPLLARCESAIKQVSGPANQASVGACVQCAASLPPSKNVDAVVEACVSCSSSRDPAKCRACLIGAAPNFCADDAADDENDNSSSSLGCIPETDATVCKTCTDASQGAAVDQCSAAAARLPFSPDVAACAALPSPERRAGCYACAATAATTVGGCADCAGLPGDMDTTAKPSALRRRHLASQQPVTLEPAAASVSGPASAPNGTTTTPGRATTSVVVDAPPLAATASPAKDCASCLADPGLSSNEEARSWCFACASRHKDDPTARAACFACLRRPLEELTAEAERAQEEGRQAGGAARRGRGGAPPAWGDLCR